MMSNELMQQNEDNEKREHDSDAPEVLSSLPELPKEFRQFVLQTLSISGKMGPKESSIAKKITGEHITQQLKLEEKEIEIQYKDNNSHRLFLLAIAAVAVSLIIAILVLFRDKPEMVEKILFAAGGLLAGIGGGYGIGKSKRD